MTGLLTTMVICLTLICLACLSGTIFLVWWNLGSAGKHSISAHKQQTLALEAMRESNAASVEIVSLQAKLTETLLLGRPMPETSLPPEPESPSEISLTPDDLWKQLPPHIQDNMLREEEELGTWPNPSETLQRLLDEEEPAVP